MKFVADRLNLFCCRLEASQHGIELFTAKIASVHNDCTNLLCIRNIFKCALATDWFRPAYESGLPLPLAQARSAWLE
jgi:hypothetical protein